jgi:F420-non-reducing hydrogenase large subunit
MMGGRPTHSINLLPGGMSKPINEEERKEIEEMGKFAVEFGKFSLQLFKDVVLANKAYVDVILSEPYKLDSYYMGLVDENNKVNFYDGKVRVTGPDGKEFVKYAPAEYLDVIAEHVEPYTYLKYPYLKKIGWKGLKDGPDSGMYQATPLSRLNASDGMATPLAQEAYEEFYATLGGKPVKATLAAHWARLVEMLYCGERWLELAQDPEITDPNVRTIPTATPSEGVAIVEAPRGTLTHHYITDEKGIVKKANLIVGTTNNYAAISAVVRNVAKALIKGGKADNATLNMIEMGFRSYDPCFGCATHALGRTPLEIRILDSAGELVERLTQNI